VCLTGALPVHLKSSPPLDPQTEKQSAELWREGVRIVSRMKNSQSTITPQLKRLKQQLSDFEKDEVREELKWEISTALVAGGIPSEMICTMKMVFANLIIEGIEWVHTEPGDSIILYLKCGSVEILLNLRKMILSGFLLRLLSDVIKQFIRSQPRFQLVVKEDDYNLTFFYLSTVAGNSSKLLYYQRHTIKMEMQVKQNTH